MMMKLKGYPGLWALVLLLVLGFSALGTGLNPRDARAEGGDWKNVALIYATDVKGKVEPCG